MRLTRTTAFNFYDEDIPTRDVYYVMHDWCLYIEVHIQGLLVFISALNTVSNLILETRLIEINIDRIY